MSHTIEHARTQIKDLIDSTGRTLSAASDMQARERQLAAELKSTTEELQQELSAIDRLVTSLEAKKAQVEKADGGHPAAVSKITEALTSTDSPTLADRFDTAKNDLANAGIEDSHLTDLLDLLDGLQSPYQDDVDTADSAYDTAFDSWVDARAEVQKKAHALERKSAPVLSLTDDTRRLYDEATTSLEQAEQRINAGDDASLRRAVLHLWRADRLFTELRADDGYNADSPGSPDYLDPEWNNTYDAYKDALITLHDATAELYQARIDLAVAKRNLAAHTAQHLSAYDSELADKITELQNP